MHPETLTYQWLTPILISLIGLFVSIIGVMIKGYLQSIDKNIEKVKTDLIFHVEKVESFIAKANERYFEVDKRVTRLEDHYSIHK